MSFPRLGEESRETGLAAGGGEASEAADGFWEA